MCKLRIVKLSLLESLNNQLTIKDDIIKQKIAYEKDMKTKYNLNATALDNLRCNYNNLNSLCESVSAQLSLTQRQLADATKELNALKEKYILKRDSKGHFVKKNG